MPKSLKTLLAALALVFLAAACNHKPQASKPSQTANPGPVSATTSQPSTTTPPRTPVVPAKPSGTTQTRETAGKPDYTPGYVVVRQTVEGSNFNQPYNKVKSGTTAFDLLNATHTVTATDYGSMGKFVTSIDGIKPDSKHFWELFVNGKSSNVGASNYQLQDNDIIEWKLSTINTSGE